MTTPTRPSPARLLALCSAAIALALVPVAAALSLGAAAGTEAPPDTFLAMSEPEEGEEVPRCDGPEPSICGGCGPEDTVCMDECEDPMDLACQPGCDFDPAFPGCETCPALTIDVEANADGSLSVLVDADGEFTLLRSENGEEPTTVGTFTGATVWVDANASAELWYAYAVVVDGMVCVTAFHGMPSCEEILGVPECPPECMDILAPECMPACMDPTMPGCTPCVEPTLALVANGDGSVKVDAEANGTFELWRSEDGGEPTMLGTFNGTASTVDTDTTVGLTYTYLVVIDGELCDLGEVVSVPDIPVGIGAGAAAGLGAVGYAMMRRRT